MDQSKQIAIGVTFIVSCLLLLWLLLTKMSWNPLSMVTTSADLYMTPLEEPEEEFIEVKVTPPVQGKEIAEATQTPDDLNEESQAAPPSGTNLKTLGPVDKPSQVVTQTKPSPIKEVQRPTPAKPAATVDKKAEEEKALAEQTRNKVNNAFANAANKGNATNGTTDVGTTGKQDGNPNSGGSTGATASVEGQVGGDGWIIPPYSKNIKSTMTGKVTFTVEVKQDGSVGTVRAGATKLPASVVKACMAEIKSKKFRNRNPETAQPATAYITFTFVDPKR